MRLDWIGFWRAWPSQAMVLKRSSINSLMAWSSFITLCWLLFDWARWAPAASRLRWNVHGDAAQRVVAHDGGCWHAFALGLLVAAALRQGLWFGRAVERLVAAAQHALAHVVLERQRAHRQLLGVFLDCVAAQGAGCGGLAGAL